MPTPTYTALANYTLPLTAAEITFTSIPSGYRDLIVISDVKTTGGGYNNFFAEFNGSGSTYSSVYALGNGSSTLSGTAAVFYAGTSNPSQKSISILQIMDYSATDKHKTGLMRANSGTSEYGNGMYAARWDSNSAITSIRLYSQSGVAWDTGSTFALYGIAS